MPHRTHHKQAMITRSVHGVYGAAPAALQGRLEAVELLPQALQAHAPLLPLAHRHLCSGGGGGDKSSAAEAEAAATWTAGR